MAVVKVLKKIGILVEVMVAEQFLEIHVLDDFCCRHFFNG